MSELKPCPWCKSTNKPEIITIDNADREGVPVCMRCEGCGGCTPWEYVVSDYPPDDPEVWASMGAIWNTRPIEAALRAEVATFDAERKDYLRQIRERNAENIALKAELAKRDEPLRPALATFALAMELKLRENDHKGGWDGCSDHWLMGRLYDEASELVGAIKLGDPEEIASEAADVANFAMMIADIAAIRRVRAASEGGEMEAGK